ncbi:MAG TPA: response regulator [Chthoniobacter sp.]|nr:response regulator [Chthoniobacter sp.]
MNTNSVGETRAKVLVIDDEPAILFTLKRILEHAGFDVCTAQSGAEGLNLFQQRQWDWDVVTLDRSMPGMNGEEVAAEIRRIAPTQPLILITGFTTAVVRPELFDQILPKPFRAVELLECISQLLAKHGRASRQHASC